MFHESIANPPYLLYRSLFHIGLGDWLGDGNPETCLEEIPRSTHPQIHTGCPESMHQVQPFEFP